MRMVSLLALALLASPAMAAQEDEEAGVYRCVAAGKPTHYVDKPVAGMDCKSMEIAPPPPVAPAVVEEGGEANAPEPQGVVAPHLSVEDESDGRGE